MTTSKMLELLREEYTIVQAKIDNIGDARFRVRGWLITIYSALLFGVFAGQINIILWLPMGILIVIIFHFLEREQIGLQYKLSNRAKKIEHAIFTLTASRKSSNKLNRSTAINAAVSIVRSTPRIGVELTSANRQSDNRLKRSLQFIYSIIYWKTNWFFIVLYLLTAFVSLVTLTKILPEDVSLITKQTEERPAIKIIDNTSNTIIKKKSMKIDEALLTVENEMSSLVSQIDFGDVSEIDAYWASLAEALADLPIRGWEPPKKKRVSAIIESINVNSANSLAKLAAGMEVLGKTGSNSSISEDNLDKLQEEANKFEAEFEIFLAEVRELVEDEE